MKKSIFILLSFLMISCYQQERNCTDFKIGTFEFIQEVDGVEKKSVFERDDNIQIETYEGKTDTASVRWINDCEFVLKKINPKNMAEKKAIHIKILTTRDNSYTFEYNFVGESNKQKGIVTKIK